jgi:hypothetical protein
MMTKEEIERLRLKIQNMTPQQGLFKMLKEELSAKGYWRNLPRGNPLKGFSVGWGKHKR